MTQKNYLAKKIKEVYDFNNYELSKEKLKEIASIMVEYIERFKISDKEIDRFFKDIHDGNLGMFYKQPVSFLSKFQFYFQQRKSNINLPSRQKL